MIEINMKKLLSFDPMNSFVQCHFCKNVANNPLELLCRHSYCSNCLTKRIENDKIICPICRTEHSALGSSLTSARADPLTTYLIGLHRGTLYSTITDDSPATIQAQCIECKTTTDLRPCFHCEKALCSPCRTKHYESQKKEVDQSIQQLANRTDQLIVLMQTQNNNRKTRIEDYRKTKEQLSTHMQDLIKIIQDEEREFQEKINERIDAELEKMNITEQEEQYLKNNKAALEEILEKYRTEKSQMVLIKMHKDYLDSAGFWKEKLQSQSDRLKSTREDELTFHQSYPTKTEPLLGKLVDAKKSNASLPEQSKRVVMRNDDQNASRTCSIQ